MNIFAAFALVALGIALSETYAFIRRRAERAAYDRGYKQAYRENEIRDDAIDSYAVITPRKLAAYQADEMQEWDGRRAPGDVPCPTGNMAKKLMQVGQSFMDHMQANGQATLWMGKEETK